MPAKKLSKPSAADRTVDIFTKTTAVEAATAALEDVQEDARDGFVPIEANADNNREKAFQVQEWATKAFGRPADSEETAEYRLTLKGDHYYLEELASEPGAKTAHKYAGLMIRRQNLVNLTKVLAEAARKELKK
jgi:hypothetical protein